tara:strand:+ start:58 stop:576 length:519 start_codon:yes stop_codon:yes gene_type:complete
MKKFIFIFLIFTQISCDKDEMSEISDNNEINSLIEVTVFMFELCPVAQYMTLPLRNLYEEFASKNIIFRAVFPNLISNQETVLNFADKYSIPFNCVLDENQELVNQFNASVYSEVFVHFSDNLVYKGMVNDSYSAPGQWSKPDNHYLYDVLSQLTQGENVGYFENNAVGCNI